jgi:hypothetical protein
MKSSIQVVRVTTFVLAFAAALLLCGAAFGQAGRYALVIGNADYSDMRPLKNPVNDASDMAAALKRLGFQVSLLTDANRKVMNQGLNDFHDKLARSSATEGFFWYAGHGVQSKGENYLIPVSADIRREVDLDDEAVSVRKLLALLDDARNRVNVVVLDACRNNLLPSMGRSGTRGFKVVDAAPPESVIMYSTGAGQEAADGEGRNSPFAQAFMKYIGQAGDITATIKAVTAETKRLTAGAQVPYLYSSLTLDFALNPKAGSAPAPAVTPAKKPSLIVEKAYGSVTVEVKTKGTMYLNGTALGQLTPGARAQLNDVEAGRANLEMRYADGKAETKAVDVSQNAVTVVSFTYVERPKAPATAGTRIRLQNQEQILFYYVLDPNELAGLLPSSAGMKEKVTAYFSAESADLPFTALLPSSEAVIEDVPNGQHLLVGFFATEDRGSFPVRVIVLSADSSLGERSYGVYSEPAYISVEKGKGRLSRFPEKK